MLQIAMAFRIAGSLLLLGRLFLPLAFLSPAPPDQARECHDHLNRASFPPGFLFGTSSSAYQVCSPFCPPPPPPFFTVSWFNSTVYFHHSTKEQQQQVARDLVCGIHSLTGTQVLLSPLNILLVFLTFLGISHFSVFKHSIFNFITKIW